MNPKYGELSRAMRNRCVEIFLPDIFHRRDQISLLKQQKLSSSQITALLRVMDVQDHSHGQ